MFEISRYILIWDAHFLLQFCVISITSFWVGLLWFSALQLTILPPHQERPSDKETSDPKRKRESLEAATAPAKETEVKV